MKLKHIISKVTVTLFVLTLFCLTFYSTHAISQVFIIGNATPDLHSYLTYTGATGNVDLNNKNLSGINTLILPLTNCSASQVLTSDAVTGQVYCINISSSFNLSGLYINISSLQSYQTNSYINISSLQSSNVTTNQRIDAVNGTRNNFTSTGTANYVPYSINSTMLNDSGLYYNESTGYFGINTTDTNNLLQVDGSFLAGRIINTGIRLSNGTISVSLYPGTSGAVTPLIVKGSSQAFSSPGMYLRTGANGNIILVDTGGYVGINAISPTTELDVNGTITATGGNSNNWNAAYGYGDHSGLYTNISNLQSYQTNSYANVSSLQTYQTNSYANISNLQNSNATIFVRVDTLNSTSGGVYTNVSALQTFRTNIYTNVSSLQSSNTTTNSRIDSLNSTKANLIGDNNFIGNNYFIGNVTIYNSSQTAYNTTIQLKDGAGAVKVNISAQADTFFNGGNVGIGTTEPTYTLDVLGTSNEKKLARFTSDDNDIVVIDDDGNIGVGTTSPAANIDVNVFGNAYVRVGGTDGYDAGYTIYQDNNTHIASMYYDDSEELFRIGTWTAEPLLLSTNKAAGENIGLYIGADGKVGVGTTAPGAKLSVKGITRFGYGEDDANYYMDLIPIADGDGNVRYDFSMKDFGGLQNQVAMTIKGQDGNVGIGTTAPNYKLEVNGTASTTGLLTRDLIVSNLITGSQLSLPIDNYYIEQLTATGWSNTGLMIGSGSDWGVSRRELTIKNGKVGIGTTTPGAKLTVFGVDDNTVVGASSEASLEIVNNYAADFGRLSELKFSAAASGYPMAAISSAYTAWDAAGLSGDLRFSTRSVAGATLTEKMRISVAGGLSVGNSYVATDAGAGNMIISGNVGIGTTSPTSKLDVAGNASITGNLAVGNTTTGQVAFGNGGGFSWNSTDTCMISPANTTNSQSVFCVTKPIG